ncbi:Nucleolar protein 12 (25kDa) family protein [Leishmania donovani]|uniref:Nucleolar protein 12 (25kDa) family protein n=1 Tax=Leishmania donovani TaxID=5661 RepID=A0A504XSG1_LEIDO|nr:Nucleolar protein 12 (25kDa) family protein [Leishmania donovani]
MRKGFKSDRLENYKRMLAKKNGKTVRDAPTCTARPKALTFDDSSRRDYLLTLHKKKNERRVQAFVDAKRKQRKDSAKTRREQREEARRAYNNYARVPILPDYTYRLPRQQDDIIDDPEASQRRRREKRLATLPHSAHAMPGAMLGQEAGTAADTHLPVGPSSSSKLDSEYVTVDVKPLFSTSSGDAASTRKGGDAASTRKGGAASTKTLPCNNFDDLPLVVRQELHRLRQETKGPAKTKPRMRMMKELEKIRKIRKHSRKGHGKRKASGKRKNRKK